MSGEALMAGDSESQTEKTKRQLMMPIEALLQELEDEIDTDDNDDDDDGASSSSITSSFSGSSDFVSTSSCNTEEDEDEDDGEGEEKGDCGNEENKEGQDKVENATTTEQDVGGFSSSYFSNGPRPPGFIDYRCSAKELKQLADAKLWLANHRKEVKEKLRAARRERHSDQNLMQMDDSSSNNNNNNNNNNSNFVWPTQRLKQEAVRTPPSSMIPPSAALKASVYTPPGPVPLPLPLPVLRRAQTAPETTSFRPNQQRCLQVEFNPLDMHAHNENHRKFMEMDRIGVIFDGQAKVNKKNWQPPAPPPPRKVQAMKEITINDAAAKRELPTMANIFPTTDSTNRAGPGPGPGPATVLMEVPPLSLNNNKQRRNNKNTVLSSSNTTISSSASISSNPWEQLFLTTKQSKNSNSHNNTKNKNSTFTGPPQQMKKTARHSATAAIANDDAPPPPLKRTSSGASRTSMMIAALLHTNSNKARGRSQHQQPRQHHYPSHEHHLPHKEQQYRQQERSKSPSRGQQWRRRLRHLLPIRRSRSMQDLN